MPVFNKQYGWTEEEASVVNDGMLTQNTNSFIGPPLVELICLKLLCIFSFKRLPPRVSKVVSFLLE